MVEVECSMPTDARYAEGAHSFRMLSASPIGHPPPNQASKHGRLSFEPKPFAKHFLDRSIAERIQAFLQFHKRRRLRRDPSAPNEPLVASSIKSMYRNRSDRVWM